ncbi:MAG TPA: amidohydrolase family protein [Clostridia bacterium]|nr:amidohydrolase family protein [Clostridia bacterium]
MLDILILHGFVITMEGRGLGIIEDGAVGIKGNKIEVVGVSGEIQKEYSAHRVIDAENKVVMPGLIDAHTHTGIGLIRGVSQDLKNLMQQGIWPFEELLRKDVDASVKGSAVNIIEAVKAGTTTFCDYDYPMSEIVKNHEKIGTRARVADLINELPPDSSKVKVGDLYPLDPASGNRKLQENIRLIEEWNGRDDGRITCMLGPQGPDMVSKELLLEIRSLAEKYDTQIHMHVAQGNREINQMVKRYGKRSIAYLDEIGMLNSRLLAVHLTEATPEETRTVARSGAAMILCSGSIGIIDGLIPPAAEFLEVSDRLALGSDQTPGNNCSNMFNEMKFTAILNKCKARTPDVFPAHQVLKMATIKAARAIGLGDEIGSLKEGKKADVILIDLLSPNLSPVIHTPVRNIIPNLVYSAKGSEVETVIIDGKVVVDNKVLTTVDERKAVLEANAAAKRIADQAAAKFATMETPLKDWMAEGNL